MTATDDTRVRRCRLTANAFIGGRVLGHGQEFTLAKGERGPHRTHPWKHDHCDADADQKRILADHHDEPLYEEFDEATGKWVRGKGA